MPTEDDLLLQQEIERAGMQPAALPIPTMARGSPEDGSRPGWLGLLGEVLGGGQGPGYRLRGQEEDAAGSRALLNFGINMLLASGPHRVKPDLLSAAATGLQGAQQSLGVDQQRGAAQAQADYEGQMGQAKLAQMQSHGQIERLKTLIPLLKLQQDQRALTNLKGGGDTGVAGAPNQQGASVAPGPIEGDAQARALAVRDGLMRRGMDLQTATAFAANALHESSANPNTGPGDGGASRGLFMWQGPRREAYVKKYGHEPDNAPLDEQLDFVMYELGTSETLAQRRIAAGESPEEKAQIVSQAYLRPKDTEPEKQRRAATAKQLATLAPPTPTEPSQGGRRQEASLDTGTRTDATTAPPAPGQQQPGAEPFVFRMPQGLPPEQMEEFNPNLAPSVEADLRRRIAGATTTAEGQAAIKDLATAQQAKREKAAAALTAERVRQEGVYQGTQKEQREAARRVQDKIEEERRAAERKTQEDAAAHQRAIDLANLNAENTRKQNVDSAGVRVSEKRLEDLQGRAGVAQRIIRDTRALEALAEGMGDPNALVANNPKLRDYLVSLNMPGLVGATLGELRSSQAWDKLVSGFFGDIHTPGIGSQSNTEGEWMMRQFGGPEQTVEDRMSQLAIIRKLSEHRIADHSDAQRLFVDQNGKLTGLDDKISQRSRLFDRPPEWKPNDPENLKTQGRYLMRHERGEPYAAYTANGELRYFRNEMVKDSTGKSRLQPVPLMGGSMVAE